MSQKRVTRLVLLAAAVALLALPVAWYLRPAHYLAAQWQDEMQRLPEDELPLRLRQLAELGAEGWTVVVKALDDPRRAVSGEARNILHQQLDGWQTLNLRESSPLVAGLARVLARGADEFGVAARQASTGLATRILLWPVDRTQVDGAQLVADCEHVLRTARRNRSSQADSEQLASVAVAAPSIRAYGIGIGPIESAVTALPGGNIPIEITDAAPLPRLPTQQSVTPIPDEPRLQGSSPPRLLAVPAAGRPSAAPLVPDPALAAEKVTRAPGKSKPAPDPNQQVHRGQLISVPPAAPPLGALTDLELMQALQDADQTRATAASHELARRNFESVHIDIARKMFDPDAQVRAELIDALPGIAGIDARPWLMVLSRDKDPALRRRVISMFATSNDPALHKHLQEIEQVESDPGVRQLVRRILELERR